MGDEVRQKEDLFFFEKKNQKTFAHWHRAAGRHRAPCPNKSLFASFSSEKEDLPLPFCDTPSLGYAPR
jgi:hypothetical protein